MSAPFHNLNLGNYKTEIECPTVVDKNRRLEYSYSCGKALKEHLGVKYISRSRCYYSLNLKISHAKLIE